MIIGYDSKRIFHNATGLGNYSRDLIRILSRVFPMYTFLLYNPKKEKISRFIPDKISVFEKLPQSFLGNLFPFLWRSKGIVKQLMKDNVQIFHGLTGELPFGIQKTNIKTVVTIHDLIFVRYPELYNFVDRKIYFKKFKYACEIADVVVAISEQTKNDIVEYIAISPDKIKVIYQGCHAVFKQSISPEFQQDTLKKLNIPEKYVLYVGTSKRT